MRLQTVIELKNWLETNVEDNKTLLQSLYLAFISVEYDDAICKIKFSDFGKIDLIAGTSFPIFSYFSFKNRPNIEENIHFSFSTTGYDEEEKSFTTKPNSSYYRDPPRGGFSIGYDGIHDVRYFPSRDVENIFTVRNCNAIFTTRKERDNYIEKQLNRREIIENIKNYFLPELESKIERTQEQLNALKIERHIIKTTKQIII